MPTPARIQHPSGHGAALHSRWTALYANFRHPALREALIWTFALTALALWPSSGALGFEGLGLCPLDRLGLPWCPGCGLGHGVRHALHGEWNAATLAHPLALPVLALLLYRIASVLWSAVRTRHKPLDAGPKSVLP